MINSVPLRDIPVSLQNLSDLDFDLKLKVKLDSAVVFPIHDFLLQFIIVTYISLGSFTRYKPLNC